MCIMLMRNYSQLKKYLLYRYYRYSSNSEAIRYHPRDFTPETIQMKHKALTNSQWIKEHVLETTKEKGLTMSDKMVKVFTDYVAAEMYDICYKPIDFVMVQPPHHLVFAGPPGTGKTSMAIAFAEIMYKCGLVSDPEIVTVRRDLISSKWVNEMEREMRKSLDRAAGKVMLLDEIYQLGTGGNDAKKIAGGGYESCLRAT
ncbi:uncharacterized protein [Branchiostoma lanceolatum]|uniref:uncharacterized protein isoform X1 n=1 Tax=Branchiostoma lanceolatum TaxID=7740 RepID=UPI0034531F21